MSERNVWLVYRLTKVGKTWPTKMSLEAVLDYEPADVGENGMVIRAPINRTLTENGRKVVQFRLETMAGEYGQLPDASFIPEDLLTKEETNNG